MNNFVKKFQVELNTIYQVLNQTRVTNLGRCSSQRAREDVEQPGCPPWERNFGGQGSGRRRCAARRAAKGSRRRGPGRGARPGAPGLIRWSTRLPVFNAQSQNQRAARAAPASTLRSRFAVVAASGAPDSSPARRSSALLLRGCRPAPRVSASWCPERSRADSVSRTPLSPPWTRLRGGRPVSQLLGPPGRR